MILIVEGTNRAGKSSLVKLITDNFEFFAPLGINKVICYDNRDIYRNVGLKIDKDMQAIGELRMLLNLNESMNDTLIIIDRFHITEMIYGQVKRGYNNYTLVKEFDKQLAMSGAKLIFVKNSLSHLNDEESYKTSSKKELLEIQTMMNNFIKEESGIESMKIDSDVFVSKTLETEKFLVSLFKNFIFRKSEIRSVQVQLTSDCNQNCIMCRKYTWPSKSIDINVLENKLGKYKDATFSFSGGDPLSYNNLNRLNRMLLNEDIIYQVFTNMNYDISGHDYESIERKIFLSNAKYIQVSLDGSTFETYDSIRKLKGKTVEEKKKLYESILENIESFSYKVKLNVVISNKNYEQIDSLAMYAHKIGCKIRFYKVHTQTELLINNVEDALIMTDITTLKNTYPAAYANTNLDMWDKSEAKPNYCKVKLHHRLISEEGIEFPCCNAINDNGTFIDDKYSINHLEDFSNTTKLYDFCSTCDRYVRFNKNWEEISTKEELFL